MCASGKFERRYGRDALNNTSCECVVAKANEADCLANAEVQTREEGGNFIYGTRRRTFVVKESKTAINRCIMRNTNCNKKLRYLDEEQGRCDF